MENGGNQKVNAIFEAHLNVPKPTNSASGPVRERFIRDKYERRKFYDPNAFARVSQMESQREEEEVVSGVQRRLATSRAPSDAARKRVEERATRNNGTTTTTRVIKAQTVPASSPPPPAPVVVDLLDFGDFDSPEAASAVQASVVTSTTIGVASSTTPVPSTVPTPLANKEPAELDLFASMSIGNNNPSSNTGVSNGGGQMAMNSQPVQPPPNAEPKKMTTDDILSMFNAPSAQQSSMQPNMMFPGAGMNGMAGGNNMGMMNTNMTHLQQPMGMMTNMIHQQSIGMMNSSNMNHQQQMAMMNKMQMMQMQQMMGHQGMNNMGGNNMNMGMMGGQGVGMMQQGQIPQMNNMMMMMQGGGGGIMHGGNQFVQPSQMMGQAIQQQQQSQSSPQMQQRGGAHLNQFADLGSFAR
jgi:stromal membrane-associated protein